MAEIDFRIPLQARPVQTQSIAPTLAALGQLQRGQQQGRINEQLIARGEREAAREAQIQEALSTLGQRRAPQQPGVPQPSLPFQAVSTPPGGPQALPELEDTLASQAPPQAPPALADILRPDTIASRDDVFQVANTIARLGSPERATQLIAFNDAKIDNASRAIDLTQAKMAAVGNIADLITDQASLDRWRSRLQAGMSDIWPNQRVPALYDKQKFEELVKAGLTSSQKLERVQVDISQQRSDTAAATQALRAREAAGQLPDVGGSTAFNAEFAGLFPGHPDGQRPSGPQVRQVLESMAAKKEAYAGSIQAAIVTARAEADRLNIRLTPPQIDKMVNRNEILGIAEAISTEFTDDDFRKVYGLTNLGTRKLAELTGNPRVLRLVTLVGRLRSALLFDREKGGGGALTPNEQSALEVAIVTGREVTAEQFIQKRNILESVARGQLEANLNISLGSNPQELKRVTELLADQRQAIRPGLALPITDARKKVMREKVEALRQAQ